MQSSKNLISPSVWPYRACTSADTLPGFRAILDCSHHPDVTPRPLFADAGETLKLKRLTAWTRRWTIGFGGAAGRNGYWTASLSMGLRQRSPSWHNRCRRGAVHPISVTPPLLACFSPGTARVPPTKSGLEARGSRSGAFRPGVRASKSPRAPRDTWDRAASNRSPAACRAGCGGLIRKSFAPCRTDPRSRTAPLAARRRR